MAPQKTKARLFARKSAAGSRDFAGTLKLAIASRIAKVDTEVMQGKEGPWVEVDGITFYTPNVAVSVLLKSQSNSPLASSLIEQEETQLGPLAYEGKVEDALAVANEIYHKAKGANLLGETNAPTSLDAILFSTLFHPLSSASQEVEGKYPELLGWFKALNKVNCVAKGVSDAKSLASGLTTGSAAPAGKKVVTNGPNPATRKLNKKAELVLTDEIKLPKDGEPNILITSALPYVNNIPHLGNVIGSVLSADVYARYCRARRLNTVFICGTDEYGTATETKALEEGISCQELCDKYNAIHRQVYEWFGLSFDKFGRTTTPQQTVITQDIFLKANSNGYMSTDTVVQLYCEQCHRFLADRYVEGICPHCGYDDARGDQCDKCGKLLNAIDLIKPRCKLDGNTPITRESKHIFLELDRLQMKIEEFVDRSSKEGQWSSNGVHITKSWLKEGLKPRCITRDLKWGTPVPLEEMKDKVFYVWFDACIGYPSITATYTKDWEKWWKNPKNVKLYQFMGKDNVPFHTVVFPGSQIATGEEWTMLHHISTTEYLNYENTKFSKSRGIGVFGSDVIATGIPVEVWRYYLISSRPETADSMFTWKDFIARNNGELLNNVGNFVNRVIKFVSSKYEGIVPPTDLSGEAEVALQKDVNELLVSYNESLTAVKIRQALAIAMSISARGNQYLQENKIDNSLFLNNRQRCDTVVGTAINLIYLLSALFYPYMPTTTESICRQLNAPVRDIPDTWTIDVLSGHQIGKPEYLFSRLDAGLEEEFKQRFGGKDRAPANPNQAETKKKN